MPTQNPLSNARRYWWLMFILLPALGWWLTRPDRPIRLQPDERPIFAVSSDSYLIATDQLLWDRRDSHVVRTLPRFGQKAFSANGQFLAANNVEDSLDISRPHDPAQSSNIEIVRTVDQSPPRRVIVNSPDITSIAVSSDGSLLAVGRVSGQNSQVTIWDVSTGQMIASLPFGGTRVQFTPDDRMLIAAGVNFVDTHTWNTVYRSPPDLGYYLAYAPTTQVLALNDDTRITLMNMRDTVSRLQAPQRIPMPFESIEAASFSPDGKYLAVIEETFLTGPVLWNPSISGTGEQYKEVAMALVRVSEGAVVQRFVGPKGAMAQPTFTPDGQTIMTLGPGKGLGFWHVAPREPWEQWLRMSPFGLALLLLLGWLGRGSAALWRRLRGAQAS